MNLFDFGTDCELEESSCTHKTSEKGLQMIEEAKNSTDKVWLVWSEGEVCLGDITVKDFKPIPRKHVSGGNKNTFAWEAGLCNSLGWSEFDIKQDLPFPKDRLKYYTYKLGVRPTKFVEMYNACMCKAFIPVELSSVANKFCRRYMGRFDVNLIRNLNTNKSLMVELVADGMEQIIPFFLNTPSFVWEHYKCTPSVRNFRKIVGKGLWKKLLRNSIHRSNKIAFCLEGTEDIKGRLAELQQLPTGLLPKNRFEPIPVPEEAVMFKRMRIIGNKQKQRDISNKIRDTKRMSNNLGYDLPKNSIKWNMNKWTEHHEYLREMTNLQKYSKDVFEWLKVFDKEYTSTCGKYTATILDNAFDIREEGDAMRHCVGGYSTSVKNESYLVLSIRNAECNRESTLGLRVHKEDSKISFGQHYKKCNKRVECEYEDQFAKDLLKILNEQYNK